MKKRILLLTFFALLIIEAKSQNPIRLGLNFPFRNPELTSIDNYMNHIKGSGAQLYRQMTYADVIWSQVEPKDNSWNFSYSDSVLLKYSQFDYIANLYSIKTEGIGYQVPWKSCDTIGCGWYPAKDSVETKDYLSASINRYGNIVKYWELGNEVENGVRPGGMVPKPFVQFVEYNYRWIKEINPTVKVILPSTFGTCGLPMQGRYDWFRAIFQLGAGNFCDIIGYHDYNSWWSMPIHIDSIIGIKNSFGLNHIPLWLTESSISSTQTLISPPYSSIDEQAADVWRRSSIAWAKGVELFNWHSCWSSHTTEWQEYGLLNYLGVKKKSYHSYQLLANTLVDFDSVQFISQGVVSDNNDDKNGGNGVWVVKYNIDGQNKYVMWSRDNQTYSLTPTDNIEYKITYVVPKTISPNGETVTFLTNSVVVPSGTTYNFKLSSLPILVEGTNLTTIADEYSETTNNLKIYPNPTKSSLTIICNGSIEKVEIFDYSGKLVKTEFNKEIDIADLLFGVYFLKSTTNDGEYIEKIIKE